MRYQILTSLLLAWGTTGVLADEITTTECLLLESPIQIVDGVSRNLCHQAILSDIGRQNSESFAFRSWLRQLDDLRHEGYNAEVFPSLFRRTFVPNELGTPVESLRRLGTDIERDLGVEGELILRRLHLKRVGEIVEQGVRRGWTEERVALWLVVRYERGPDRQYHFTVRETRSQSSTHRMRPDGNGSSGGNR